MIISVVQFKHPNGTQVEQTGEINDSLCEKYEAMRNAGCRITMECLPPSYDQVSICIEHPYYGDVDCAVVKNGPAVVSAVEQMIGDFDPVEFGKWVDDMEGDDFPEGDIHDLSEL